MTNEERLAFTLSKRSELEVQLRDAEILIGLIRGHLKKADEIIDEIDLERADEKGDVRRQVSKVTQAIDDQIVSAYAKGLRSFEQVARIVELHPGTVRARLIALGEYTPRAPITEDQRIEIIRRYSVQGESARQIAGSMKLSTTTVTSILRSAGYETRAVNPERNDDSYSARQRRFIHSI